MTDVDLDTDPDYPTTPYDGQDTTLPTGARLGSYRISRVIGWGGMGCVYRAEHVQLGRKVALKTLHSGFAAQNAAVSRFFSEARAANRIQHENIVEITDFLNDEASGTYYFVMELLDGVDLGKLVKSGIALPADQVLDIGIQIASALNAAHEAGIVHRDLKPANIFLIERGGKKNFVKLLDFGTAKLAETQMIEPLQPYRSGRYTPHMTEVGVVLGTPAYMSPENARAKPTDHRTDIYSFGVVLYQMVTGKLPFTGDNPEEILVKQATHQPVSPYELMGDSPSVPPELEELIMLCLEKDPDQRPQSVKDIELALSAISEDLRSDKAASEAEPGRRRSARWFWIAAALVIAVGVGIGVTAYLASRNDRLTTAAEEGRLAQSLELVTPKTVSTEKAVPSKIEITFESRPPGAEVWRKGGVEPMGITPVTMMFETNSEPETFEFRKEGFQASHEVAPLDRDGRLVVALEELPQKTPDQKVVKSPSIIDNRRKRGWKRPAVKGRKATSTQAKRKGGSGDLKALVDPFAR